MNCPKCEQSTLIRVQRSGLGDAFRSRFGIYPWLCLNCKSTLRLHNRGAKLGKSGSPPTSAED